LRKAGGSFDLAIALGLLAVSEQLDPSVVASVTALGELALDGTLRPTAGILPIALAARRAGRRLLLPQACAQEAALAEGVDIIPVRSLCEAVDILSGRCQIGPQMSCGALLNCDVNQYDVDFSDVKGQAHAKRALEVAVAGGHHALLIGPPGAGKTMLAQCIPTIQPELSLDDAVEATAVHSVAGVLGGKPFLTQRPFRAPHHSASTPALIGGDSPPRPGEVSLAHHGVLFLDELPEFPREALESLRQPLEEGIIRIARVARSCSFPARFQLIAAMNPCPCGFFTDPRGKCRCPATRVQSYLHKLSGPLLDRIDLHIEVPALPVEVLGQVEAAESSADIRARVLEARRRQEERGHRLALPTANVRLRHRHLRTACPMTAEAVALLKTAVKELGLSARSYHTVLRIARTIADLAGSDTLHPPHLAEAIQYRSLDRQWWG
jgi:magnesium chelatase family protein